MGEPRHGVPTVRAIDDDDVFLDDDGVVLAFATTAAAAATTTMWAQALNGWAIGRRRPCVTGDAPSA